jgi:hypothetical protein
VQRFAVRTVSGAIAVVAVGAMLAGPVAVADPVPELWLTYSQLYLGSSTEAAGTGLAPSAAYQLSVDSGGLGPSQLPTVDLTTSTLGRFSVAYVLGATRPAPTAVHFTLTTPGDPTPVAVLSVDVHPPWLYYGRACPGQPVPLTVMGLVDGNYSITASDPGVAAVETTGDDLRSSRASFPLPARIPSDFTLSVLDEQTDEMVVSGPVAMDQPTVQTAGAATPWRQVLVADCFAPGEHVIWNATPGTSAPVVTANGQGSATIPVTMHPAQQPVTTPPLGATGETSGQHAEFAPVLIAGTTLLVGHSLGPDIRPFVLASAAPPPTAGYSFQTNGGNLAILHDGQPYWFSRSFLASCSCVLTMQSDGNLVLPNARGHCRLVDRHGEDGQQQPADHRGLRQPRAQDGIWRSTVDERGRLDPRDERLHQPGIDRRLSGLCDGVRLGPCEPAQENRCTRL